MLFIPLNTSSQEASQEAPQNAFGVTSLGWFEVGEGLWRFSLMQSTSFKGSSPSPRIFGFEEPAGTWGPVQVSTSAGAVTGRTRKPKPHTFCPRPEQAYKGTSVHRHKATLPSNMTR